MRTRIALVAIVSIALITVTLLTQAVTVQPARASVRLPHLSTAPSPNATTDQLTSFVWPGSTPVPTSLQPGMHLDAPLLTGKVAGVKEVAPVIIDTVTPAERAAWQRVAICEEGGNWQADGPRFSGGLGITRSNWAIYGGLRYAPRGALATPDEQIMVAQRIQSNAPDQHGCHGW